MTKLIGATAGMQNIRVNKLIGMTGSMGKIRFTKLIGVTGGDSIPVKLVGVVGGKRVKVTIACSNVKGAITSFHSKKGCACNVLNVKCGRGVGGGKLITRTKLKTRVPIVG